MARLPNPGSDSGVWGNILNDFLSVSHESDGTLKTSALPAATPDATSSIKGKIQLTGDLGGTASSPTVPALASKADDSAVVHIAGTETITGAKTFSASPVVPAPSIGTHAATKDYVDSAAVNPNGLIAETHTNSVVVTTNTEWNLCAFALPQSVSAGETFELISFGNLLNNSGVDKALTPRLRVGSATLAGASQLVIPSSSNARQFRLNARIIIGDGGRAHVHGSFSITDGTSSANMQSPVASFTLEGATTAAAGQAPGALVQFSVQPSSGANFSTTLFAASLAELGSAPQSHVFNSGARVVGTTTYSMLSPSKEWSYRIAGAVERFELRSGDYLYSDGSSKQRVEWKQSNNPFNPADQDIWMAYGLFIETGVTSDPSVWCLLGQLHQTYDVGDTMSVSPPFSINYEAGTLSAQCRADPNAITTGSGLVTIVPWSIPSFARDQWHQFVHHIRFSPTGTNGVLETWHNGILLYSGTPAIGYNDTVGPVLQYGIYRNLAPETLAVRYANMEIGTASLASRIASPLPIT